MEHLTFYLQNMYMPKIAPKKSSAFTEYCESNSHEMLHVRKSPDDLVVHNRIEPTKQCHIAHHRQLPLSPLQMPFSPSHGPAQSSSTWTVPLFEEGQLHSSFDTINNFACCKTFGKAIISSLLIQPQPAIDVFTPYGTRLFFEGSCRTWMLWPKINGSFKNKMPMSPRPNPSALLWMMKTMTYTSLLTIHITRESQPECYTLTYLAAI